MKMSIEEEFKDFKEKVKRYLDEEVFGENMLTIPPPKKVEIKYKDGNTLTIEDPEIAGWVDAFKIFMIVKDKETRFINKTEIKEIKITDRETPS